jgi:hypothetical protein
MLDSTNIVSGLAGRVDLGLNYGLVGNSFICEDTYRYILFGILVRKEENKKFKKKKKKNCYRFIQFLSYLIMSSDCLPFRRLLKNKAALCLVSCLRSVNTLIK